MRPLNLVARQPTLPDGSRPDIVALDSSSRVVVVEVKRDLDRGAVGPLSIPGGLREEASMKSLRRLRSNPTPEGLG